MKLKIFNTRILRTDSGFTLVSGNTNKNYQGKNSGAGRASGSGIFEFTLNPKGKSYGNSYGRGISYGRGSDDGSGDGSGSFNKGIKQYEIKYQSKI